jgi:hypothetical protein
MLATYMMHVAAIGMTAGARNRRVAGGNYHLRETYISILPH